MFEEQLICLCQKCNLYMDTPINLPCGYSICKNHVSNKESIFYNCNLCKSEHFIPQEGYPINKSVKKIIDLNNHLTGLQKEAKMWYDNLKSIVDDYSNNGFVNKDQFIKEFFEHVRNDVKLHRDEIIKNLNEKSDQFIKILDKQENECKLNANKLEEIDLNHLKNDQLPEWSKDLRHPLVDNEKIQDILNKMCSSIQDIKFKIKNYKNDLLMNKKIEFKAPNLKQKHFGDLIITSRSNHLSENCGSLIRKLTGHNKNVRSIKLIPNTNRLISASIDHTIKIWNITNGECIQTLNGHENVVTCLDLMSEHKLISGSWDCQIKIWDLNKNVCSNSIKFDSQISSVCCSSSPNENKIIIGFRTGDISIFDLVEQNDNENKTSTKLINAHTKLVLSLKMANNSKFISSSADSLIKIWCLNTTSCLRTLYGHSQYVYCLELMNDGITLLSGSEDKTIKVWNIETGICLKICKLAGHVYDMKLLNNDLVAIGSNSTDCSGIFNLNTSELVKKFDKDEEMGYVFKLELVQNQILISTSTDNSIKLWNL